MLLLLALAVPAYAAGAGQTGASAGCEACHGAAATVSASLTASASTVAPGDTLTLTLDIASTNPLHVAAGLDVSATGGTLAPGADTQLVSGELTHTAPLTLAGTSRLSFSWTAPATEGTYTIAAAGLAGDLDGTAAGDADATDTLTVAVVDACEDLDGDGWEDCAGDCDDTDATVSPDGVETCDGVDEDCDGVVDDDAADTSLWYADADGDGYGIVTDRVSACDAPTGYVAVDGDCNDADTAYNPGATEPDCTDPADYNCDGSTGYDDNDGDGWTACLDCNDGAAAVHPGATETCNGVDDNCEDGVDEDEATDARTWYDDDDGDGYGDPDDDTVDCDEPRDHVTNDDDCDDTRGDAHPGATETWYDGVDQDCDGRDDDRDQDGYGIAQDCDDLDAAVYPGAPDDWWYDAIDTNCAGNSDFDADYDGFDSASFGGTDCDDANPATYPGAPEDPDDGLVNDCNATPVDDADGDGYATVDTGGDDCDDANSAIHPGAQETWYDGVDQDCDGIDNDQDGDGWPFELDCDDTDPSIGDCYDPPPDEEAPRDTPKHVDGDEEGGCACTSSGSRAGVGAGVAWVLLGLTAGLRRRR